MTTTIGLVQISSDFLSHSYLPYSVGVLQAYAQKHLKKPSDYSFLPIVFDRTPVNDAVAKLVAADVVGFSLYLWNEQISLAIAKELKRQKPEVITVFGGPQVPDDSERFLRTHNFINVACKGEGEVPFLTILENYPTRTWELIPGASYIVDDGAFRQNPPAERIKDLSQVPSPFLENIFENLFNEYPEKNWIATWETNRGCPFSCTFCDFGSAIATRVRMRVLSEIEREINWFASHKIEYVFCADANFGMFPRDIEIANLLEKCRLRTGYPHALSVENAKNVSPRSLQVQKILSAAGLSRGTVLSIQTLHEPTLQAIKRSNIPLQAFHSAQQWCRQQGVSTMTDLILGLPEESYDSFANGINLLLENGQHHRIQFNILCVLPNAEMGNPEYLERFGMKLKKIPIVNQHGALRVTNELHELQSIVVGTNTLPTSDWVRARALCWVTALLHFDKLLQIPLIVLRHTANLSYREMLEFFAEKQFLEIFPGHAQSFPLLSEIIDDFYTHAEAITRGEPEYHPSSELLGIWWPVNEHALIKLCLNEKINQFYQEAEYAFTLLLKYRDQTISDLVLHDAVKLNRALLKLPNRTNSEVLDLSWNIYEFYDGILTGQSVLLKRQRSQYLIDKTDGLWANHDEWLKKVIWYQNKTGGYLYKIHSNNMGDFA